MKDSELKLCELERIAEKHECHLQFPPIRGNCAEAIIPIGELETEDFHRLVHELLANQFYYLYDIQELGGVKDLVLAVALESLEPEVL